MQNILKLLILTFICNTAFASFPTYLNSNECDNIILQSGNEVSAMVLEITPNLIKYKKCNKEDGPIISIDKGDVFMIKYNDGTSFKIESQPRSRKGSLHKDGDLHGGFGITALICGILGFFVPLLGVLAIIFGAIGMSKKYKNRKLATAGLILGLVNLLLSLILLSLFLS